MAYKKFALSFTLIDQIVYEIITNLFIAGGPFDSFMAPNLSTSFQRRVDFTKFIFL